MLLNIYAEDCLDPEEKIPSGSVHLGIYDPPFGIGESAFDKFYKRNTNKVIQGYNEAPEDYSRWTLAWMAEAQRVLRDDGSMYVIMGHSKLRHVLNAAAEIGLCEINHLIWKFNFGVNTKRKYVTSHYHVLYYSKTEKSKPTFNLNCRFGSQEKDNVGKNSLLFKDLEDVFVINKDYAPDEVKNQNKLPQELIQKLILYSSNEGDMVCDFFMGNFTTAYVARRLRRNVCGYEINHASYDHHIGLVQAIEPGCGLSELKQVENIVPENQGKKVAAEDITAICTDFLLMDRQKMLRRDISQYLQEKYGRGRFSIKNILDANLERVKAAQSVATDIFILPGD
jgi:site-specific DNA-methyltransferase (adenine-specific)